MGGGIFKKKDNFGNFKQPNASHLAKNEKDFDRINKGVSPGDIARERAAARAKAEAEQRYLEAGPESPLGRRDSYFGIGLTKKEKSLSRIGLLQPKLVYATTTSILLGWSPEWEGAGTKIKAYEVQWRRVVDGSTLPGGVVEGWSATADQPNKKVYFRCGDRWSSIPEDLPNTLNMQMHISGLPLDCGAFRFRVRGRCHAGWGHWCDKPSGAMRVLPSTMPVPTISKANAYNLAIRWTPFTDERYGKLKHYIVYGKIDLEKKEKIGEENNKSKTNESSISTLDGFEECVTSTQSKLSIDRIGDEGMTPNTPYAFKVVAVVCQGAEATDRDTSLVYSEILKARTTVAPPDPPNMPTIVEVKARQCRLAWNMPCCNGTKVTSYQLVMKPGASRVYREVYVGPLTSYTVERLQPNSEYNFKVTASNARGMSEASPPVMVITDDGPKVIIPNRHSINENEQMKTDEGLAKALEDSYDHTDDDGYTSGDNNGNNSGYTDDELHSPLATIGSPTDNMYNSIHGSPQQGNIYPIQNRRNSIRNYAGDRRSPTTPNRERIGLVSNGWLECWDAKAKQTYYFHPATGSTQWEHPRGTKLDPELVFRRKRFKFLYILHKRDFSNAQRDVLPLKIKRQDLVYSSYHQFRNLTPRQLKFVPKVIFDGEEGVDSGGLTKDWFLELSREFVNPSLVLFRKCNSSKNGQHEIDPRSAINEEHLHYFRFIGQIMGKAAYDRQLIDMDICGEIYKHILRIEPKLLDLKAKDEVYYKSLKWMLDNDITDVVYETFTTTTEYFGVVSTIELRPNGGKIEVDQTNKAEYVNALVRWRLFGCMEDQIQSLCQGFYDVIPFESIETFTPTELELLLNGKEEIDLEEVKSSTKYTGGYTESDSTVDLFWKIFENFDPSLRAKLLAFSTGTTKVPLDGFEPLYTITKGTDGIDALPRSHTCFNQIVIPPYKDEKQFREKLILAIENTSGFQLS